MNLRLTLMLACLLAWAGHGLPAAAPGGPPNEDPAVCMGRAWNVTWERFYLPKTNLFYDYLSSYEAGREPAHLPTADEVRRQYPNECGYGTGVEDGMISAGVMLSLIVDRYAVTKDESLRDRAYRVFQGIQLCAAAHGAGGFLARAVCDEDLKRIYFNSSRDQYTHAVHRLWLDLTMTRSDWRTSEGLSSKGEYRKVWYNIRESGEAALAQLVDQGASYPAEQQALLTRATARLDYDRVSSCGISYLQAAYWKARRHGLMCKGK